jgi:hypothetical protein
MCFDAAVTTRLPHSREASLRGKNALSGASLAPTGDGEDKKSTLIRTDVIPT